MLNKKFRKASDFEIHDISEGEDSKPSNVWRKQVCSISLELIDLVIISNNSISDQEWVVSTTETPKPYKPIIQNIKRSVCVQANVKNTVFGDKFYLAVEDDSLDLTLEPVVMYVLIKAGEPLLEDFEPYEKGTYPGVGFIGESTPGERAYGLELTMPKDILSLLIDDIKTGISPRLNMNIFLQAFERHGNLHGWDYRNAQELIVLDNQSASIRNISVFSTLDREKTDDVLTDVDDGLPESVDASYVSETSNKIINQLAENTKSVNNILLPLWILVIIVLFKIFF